MKDLVFIIILSGWILGALISCITENLYIPAITVFMFVFIALIVFLFNINEIKNENEK
jgi:hypothetical protein